MLSSDYAFDRRLLIVLSTETANIAIFSCVSIFNDIFLLARVPTTRSTPITFDTASIPITAGAAIIVERRSTPVITNPIAETSNQFSITPIILTPLLYFVLSFCNTLYIYIITISFNNFHFLLYNIFFVLKIILQNHIKNGNNFKWTIRA